MQEKKEKGLSCNTSSCLSTASTEFVPESYPYDVDPDDHCETSITAYQHALPVLDFLRKNLEVLDVSVNFSPFNHMEALIQLLAAKVYEISN